MKESIGVLLTVAALCGSLPVHAGTITINDWGFNLNGALYLNGGSPAPPFFDTSQFDFNTGLGTVNVAFSPVAAGNYYLLAYFDLDIDEAVNTAFNEIGLTSGTPSARQSWQIGDPNATNPPDLFDNFTSNALDNTNHATSPGDVAWAMGFQFSVLSGETENIVFSISQSQPTSGFYLQQNDTGSQANIYFSGNAPGGAASNIPEPGTAALALVGLSGAIACWRVKKARRCRRIGRGPHITMHFSALGLAVAVVVLALPQRALAVKATVKTVPWVASNPLIAHDTFSGKQITIKGTADVQGNNFKWTWDFGDGSPVASGTVTNSYVIEATHTYNGVPGQIFTARLSVQDINTGDVGTGNYFVEIRQKSLQIEANVAVDEGLWYLHKTQNRTISGMTPLGDWLSGGFASSTWYGVTAADVNAFETNGHLELGDPADPYTDTVQRGLRNLFNWLTTSAVSLQTNGLGTFNPDTNGNGYAAYVNQGNPFYQGGMFIDAIVASGNGDTVAITGASGSGLNPGIRGRRYRDIVADMADGYLFCQYTGSAGGGWRYSCGQAPDNSACQWAAIGLIPVQREFGLAIPAIVKNWNKVWLQNSQNAATGQFGYTDPNPAWGPFAETASGMVQMAMDGIGRGDSRWDKAETFMRNNFGNAVSAGPTAAPRAYYYGLFSLVKSLLLHDPAGTGVAQPIALLQSSTAGVQAIDWYNAQVSDGGSTDGVARTLINDQSAAGYWTAHDFNGDQYPFETAFAIIMLNRIIFNSGAPVAVAQATPNPLASGGTVTFDGSGSFQQDPLRRIVLWQWDFSGSTNFTATGPQVTHTFNVGIGTYPVRLQVTDDSVPAKTAETIINILVSNPPIAPTANAGGPYSFCPQTTPWFLDGTKSVNPDDGQHDPGAPGDVITSYQWDLNGQNTFTDASGPTPNVTTLFSARLGASLNISLKVTDNTAASFPTSGRPNLSSIASTQVVIHLPSDPACTQCISNLSANPKIAVAGTPARVDVAWTDTGADHYNVYRGVTNNGPYTKIGVSNVLSPPTVVYIDNAVVVGNTYYYVVRPANAAGSETCQSNQVSATIRQR